MDKTKLAIAMGVILIVAVGGLFTLSTTSSLPDKKPTNSTGNDEALLIEEVAVDDRQFSNEGPRLVNTVWMAHSINGQSISNNSSISIQFNEDGQISGTDGCNNFSSTYSQVGIDGGLTISPNMMGTQMACETSTMEVASAFTTNLLATTRFTLNDGVLTLLQDEVAGLVFTGQSNPISKSSWTITGYNNGQMAVVSPILETNLTLNFGEDGSLSGSAGCNNFTSTYTFTPNSNAMTIGPVATTMMFCEEPEGSMEQEAQFVKALESVASWNIVGDLLTLRTAEDSMAINATRSTN